jgi:chloramphenicol 3-O phosphotransferase
LASVDGKSEGTSEVAETQIAPGQLVILNGAPRSGKSSIVTAIQASFDGLWLNLGVDISVRHMTPSRYRPGMGLRPGGERQDIEPLVPTLYAALYESIATHSRLGLNVVVDVGHHDSYAVPRGILADSARRLAGQPVLFVGVRCPIEVIMARMVAGQPGREGEYGNPSATDPIPDAVRRWSAVHDPGIYDLEVDTSAMSPEECARAIRRLLDAGVPRPTAFERLAKPT